ncbi:MAG: hypothetical protein IPO15_12185 [Anaerolineae bacterium]|uniref:hypothetical protein n=1 Tax=Candidatus Amarolinea dominans TaxID=3140696 RepID=UPI003135C73D|nr:hypothetical protein [Anaerolineae bacterium]
MIVAFTENALEREHDEWLLFLDASSDSWLPAMVTEATMHGQWAETQTGGATPSSSSTVVNDWAASSGEVFRLHDLCRLPGLFGDAA